MKSKQDKNEDDELSSVVQPAISSTNDENLTDHFSLINQNRMFRKHAHSSTTREPLEETKANIDPWVRRCDQTLQTQISYVPNQEENSIQYETRPYYRSLSSTSDECLLQHQQTRQPALNSIDKDIEYVESRLRGRTTISLPTCHSTNFGNDTSWRQASMRNYPINIALSTSSMSDGRHLIHQTDENYSNRTSQQKINRSIRSSKPTIATEKSQQNETNYFVNSRCACRLNITIHIIYLLIHIASGIPQ